MGAGHISITRSSSNTMTVDGKVEEI